MRKAPMGLFNLKKSKKKDDDFEASDEWLMGLADDAEFDGAAGGPNSSIPGGLASLAPDDFDALPPSDYNGRPVEGFDDELVDRELLDSDNVDLSSWHFPDLGGDGPAASDDVAMAPLEPHVDELAASHVESDTGFLAKQPSGNGMGFGSDLFASGIDADIEDAIIEESFASETPDPAAPYLALDDIPALDNTPALGHYSVDELLTAQTAAPRSHEADLLCEILGVEPGSDWSQLQAAHAAAMSEYDPRLESDEDRIALAWAIRREMNSTYAMLRLLAAV